MVLSLPNHHMKMKSDHIRRRVQERHLARDLVPVRSNSNLLFLRDLVQLRPRRTSTGGPEMARSLQVMGCRRLSLGILSIRADLASINRFTGPEAPERHHGDLPPNLHERTARMATRRRLQLLLHQLRIQQHVPWKPTSQIGLRYGRLQQQHLPVL